ncbi:MAG: SGNH/GDSL hydrolase family protein [Candidatus Hodarchaeales archaeon]|jgi:lysophospholipase L1-like esterase
MRTPPELSISKKILFTLTPLLLILLIAEIFLQIRERSYESKTGWVGGSIEYFIPHQFLNFALNPKHPNHNSLGFRGKEINVEKGNHFRIFCFGGSSTYGSRVFEEHAYPYVLDKLLSETRINNNKIEAINAGLPGYASGHILSLFHFRILPLSPDMIIVYSGYNDLQPRLAGTSASDYTGFFKTWDNPYFKRILFSSILARKIIGQRIAVKFNIPDLIWPPHIVDLVSTGFSKHSEANLKKTTPAVFHRNILSLVQLAKANDVKVALVTLAFWPDKKNTLVNAYKQGIMEHNEETRKIARNENVFLIDLEKIFPRKAHLFADDIHMSEEGNAIRAKLIYEALLKSGKKLGFSLINSPIAKFNTYEH